MKRLWILTCLLTALTATTAQAKPIKEAAKEEIQKEITKAINYAKAESKPSSGQHPENSPPGFAERTEQALKDHFAPVVREKLKDHEESKGPPELSPDDKGYGAGSTRGQPKVPSQCAESESCRVCYASAQGDLNHLRFSLEKLRVIGSWTRKFTDKSIAFGDSVSGVHGVAGLGWQPERAKIQESYEQFGKAYDAKYEELIGDLEGALREVGQCEAQHFKTADWYDRYGFIYYTFMSDRYRRDD